MVQDNSDVFYHQHCPTFSSKKILEGNVSVGGRIIIDTRMTCLESLARRMNSKKCLIVSTKQPMPKYGNRAREDKHDAEQFGWVWALYQTEPEKSSFMIGSLFLCFYITKYTYIILTPLKPRFYIVKLGFTGVYIIFLIFAQNIDCGYSFAYPCRGGSNEYPQSMFWAENIKKYHIFFYLNIFSLWRWKFLYIWIGVFL